MDRLKHGNPVRIDVSRGGHAQSPLEGGAEVCDDVAKHVVRNDNLELLWFTDHLHGQSIDEEMFGHHIRVLGCYFVEGSLPEVVSVAQGVTLVCHSHFTQTMGL